MNRWQKRLGRGQRKHRRNIFAELRRRGYTTKAELAPFKGAIRLAVCDNQPFNFPESLILMQRRQMGEAKTLARAKVRQAELEARQKTHRERSQPAPRRWPWGW